MNKIIHSVLDIQIGLLWGHFVNKQVNKNVQCLLADSQTLSGVNILLYNLFKKTLFERYIIEMI